MVDSGPPKTPDSVPGSLRDANWQFRSEPTVGFPGVPSTVPEPCLLFKDQIVRVKIKILGFRIRYLGQKSNILVILIKS